MRERQARDAVHLQRALDTLAVGGRQACGGYRVHGGEFGMHRRPSFGGSLGFQHCAHRRVGRWHVIQAIEQGLEVQHGAAHQQWRFAPLPDVGDQGLRVTHELGGTVGLQWVTNINQVVGHGGQFLWAGFGSANVHAAVDQGGVDTDDLYGALARNRQRHGGFAGRSRSGNADGQQVQSTRADHSAVPGSRT